MLKRLFLIALTGAALATTLSACVVAPVPVSSPGYMHDRDGDGVPNRYDRRPNNPYRN